MKDCSIFCNMVSETQKYKKDVVMKDVKKDVDQNYDIKILAVF